MCSRSLNHSRISDHALHELEKHSTKFEDLSLGDNRPSQLVRRYGEIYAESRLDAFDALDELSEIADFDELKAKLLFSCIVVSINHEPKWQWDYRGILLKWKP